MPTDVVACQVFDRIAIRGTRCGELGKTVLNILPKRQVWIRDKSILILQLPPVVADLLVSSVHAAPVFEPHGPL